MLSRVKIKVAFFWDTVYMQVNNLKCYTSTDVCPNAYISLTCYL